MTTPAYSTGLPLIFRSHKTPRANFHVSRISAEVMTRGVHVWPLLAGAARFTHVPSAKVGGTPAIEACVVYAKYKFKSLEFNGAVSQLVSVTRRDHKKRSVLSFDATLLSRRSYFSHFQPSKVSYVICVLHNPSVSTMMTP